MERMSCMKGLEVKDLFEGIMFSWMCWDLHKVLIRSKGDLFGANVFFEVKS